jgi:hypothetical protein
MERIIRKIVQEELRKTLLEIADFQQVDDEPILYNFESGRAFGVNKLSKDISGLQHYYMSSYFPNSEMKETWMFEIDTNYGGSQLIEIIHMISPNYESYWKLNLGEVERGSNEPVMIESVGPVQGYKNFIQAVNSKLSRKIDPDLI